MYLLAQRLPVTYIENPLTLLNEQWRWDINKINSLAKESAVLINCCLENWGTDNFIGSLYDELERANVNFLILTHIYENHLTRPKLIHHPYWYHEKVVHGFNYTLTPIEKVVIPPLVDQKSYSISCLHGNPRPHRVLNYFKMQEYSSNKVINQIFGGNLDHRINEDYQLDDCYKQWWEIVNVTLPTRHQIAESEGLPNWVNVGTDVSHPAFTDAYINIVPETTIINRIHQTEKIWKPILSGQMFVALANPFYIDRLRKQGVDVYDDVIDHSYYDCELDFETRFNKLHTLIKDLLSKDLLSINIALHNRRQRNIDNFYSGKFDPHKNDLVQALKQLIKDNTYEIPSD